MVDDLVKGEVTLQNENLDDLILLRSDGTPTYNLAVVVDDHDMGVTHVIRGDDHLNNAARQTLIYRAMDWEVPVLAHLPLIHGPDGAKLSKRHGAQAVEDTATWATCPRRCATTWPGSAGATATTSSSPTTQAIAWFDLDAPVKAPARLDWAKLKNLNSHYIRAADDAALLAGSRAFLQRNRDRP